MFLLLSGLLLWAGTPCFADEVPVRSGPWKPGDPPEGWVLLETEHYQVQSEVGLDTAKRLATHLESMLERYRSFLPSTRRLPPFVLKVFRNRAAYERYGGTSVAHYDPIQKELVCYDTGVSFGIAHTPPAIRLGNPDSVYLDATQHSRLEELFQQITLAHTPDLAEVLAHEAWHQYFHEYTVSWVAMPSWIDEGVGDWLSTPLTADGTPALHQSRLRDVQQALRAGHTVPFSTLLQFEQEQYYANPEVFYAQGWSMVAYLMAHESPAQRAVVPDLIRHFKRTKNIGEATKLAFKQLDVEQLHREWMAWVLSQRAEQPLRALAREFGGLIEPEQLEAPVDWKQRYEQHIREDGEQREGALGTEGQALPHSGAGRAGRAGDGGKNGAGERN